MASSAARRLALVKNQRTVQLTTLGRRTGKRHTVTVWFLVAKSTVYLVTLDARRDWPRNVLRNGYVELNLGGATLVGTATPVKDPRLFGRIKRLLRQKYWTAWLGSWFGLGPEAAFAVTIES